VIIGYAQIAVSNQSDLACILAHSGFGDTGELKYSLRVSRRMTIRRAVEADI